MIEENAPSTITSPTELSGASQLTPLWDELKLLKQQLEDSKKDFQKYQKELTDELKLLKQQIEESGKYLQEYRRDLTKVNNFIVGIVVVTSITFITTLSLVFFDMVKDKELYMQNNNLYQSYSNKNYEQLIEINNLKNEISILRAKNPNLK